MIVTFEKIKLPLAKRIFDIIFDIIFSLIFLPFCLFILIWIFIEQIIIKESRGSLFYGELRISQGNLFKFYKWRIYKVSAIKKALENDGIVHTVKLQEDKNNLTYYGRFLQKIYMDEIPQLWNVLKGDMTLVGPRPTNLETSKIRLDNGDISREIFKCGITGPFQAEKGHKGFDQKQMDKEYIEFIKRNSGWKIILKDIVILLKTIRIIVEAKGI